MGSRSNISLVGNTTYGINCGNGACIYDCKSGSNLLIFKTICGAGTVSIISGDTTVTISGVSDVTGVTNLGSGDGNIYTNVSDRKINLKTLSGGTNVNISSDSNYITISANDTSGIEWSSSTVNGIGTYIDADTICSQSGLTYNGITLSVIGAIESNSTLDILSTANLRAAVNITGATTLSAVASYLTDLSPFTARQIPDAAWVTGCTSTAGIQTVNNGLTKVGTNAVLGGVLTGNTNLTGAYDLSFSHTNINLTGAVGITGAANISGAIDGNSTLDILGATALRSTLAVTGATSLNAVASYLTDLSPFTARQIPDAAWVTGCTSTAGIGWSNLANGSTVAGCGTIASGSSNCNTVYGVYALSGNTTGNHNVAIGTCTLLSNNGSGNVAIGSSSLFNNITGCYNVAQGYQALYCNTSGCYNVANGYQALSGNTTGNYNVAQGYQALYCNITGDYNIALGRYTLYRNISGCDNIANGHFALQVNSSGCCNIGIGNHALNFNLTGSNNIAIGNYAGQNSIGNTNVFFGYCAGYNEIGSNKLHIANSYNCTLICGDFAGKTVCIDNCLYVNSVTCPSDCRLKSNISAISIAPVNVEYKQFNHCDTPNKISVGVIAQELCQTHPDLVSINDKGYLGINYGELHSLEIAYLKCKVCELEKKINKLI